MKILEALISLLTRLFNKDVDEAKTIENPTAEVTTEAPTEAPTEVATTAPTEAPTTTPLSTSNDIDETLYTHNKYNNVVVLLDHGHCASTPGKDSPDGRLKEYAYNRIIVKGIEAKLDKLGIKYWNDHPEEDFVIKDKGTCKDLDSRDLVLRVERINKKYAELKAAGLKSFLISVHVDAAANSGWHTATGWASWTTRGQNNSDILADKMYDAAESILKPLNKKIRTEMSDKDRDWESNFYILRKSDCVCTLTENFFQDNKDDVDWLLSDEGKQTIIDIHIRGILNYINYIV